MSNLRRTPAGLLVKEWASDTGAILRFPESEGLSRGRGLPASYDMDNYIAVGLFNQWLNELTAFLKDAENTGILPWVGDIETSNIEAYDSGAGINYLAGEFVLGSDNNVYVCLTSEGSLTNDPVTDADNSHWMLLRERTEPYIVGALVLGSDEMIYRCRDSAQSLAVDPITDTDEDTWERFIRTVPRATEVNPGTVRLATVAETLAGTATDRAITPEGLAEAITDRIATLASDGVVTGATLTDTTLTLTRSGGRASFSVNLAPLFAGLAPINDPTFIGRVQGINSDASNNAATTALVRLAADRAFSVPATESDFGVAELATEAEITAGLRSDIFVDVAGLEERVGHLVGPTGNPGDRGPTTTGPRGEQGAQGAAGSQVDGPMFDLVAGGIELLPTSTEYAVLFRNRVFLTPTGSSDHRIHGTMCFWSPGNNRPFTFSLEIIRPYSYVDDLRNIWTTEITNPHTNLVHARVTFRTGETVISASRRDYTLYARNEGSTPLYLFLHITGALG